LISLITEPSPLDPLENNIGQFEPFMPSRLRDRKRFVRETLASTGATGGSASKRPYHCPLDMNIERA
jgi:hypothetical protein